LFDLSLLVFARRGVWMILSGSGWGGCMSDFGDDLGTENLYSGNLYFKGVSLRKIVDHLQQFEHITVSHVAVLKWIQKYVAVMRDYVDAMKPQLSRVFHADETKVNIWGQWLWLWHLMDGDTRFLLANHVSQGRNVSDARETFQDAKAVAKVEPGVLLTDGLGTYGPAARREFPDAVHVAGVGFAGSFEQ
jgi:transposase-like protein